MFHSVCQSTVLTRLVGTMLPCPVLALVSIEMLLPFSYTSLAIYAYYKTLSRRCKVLWRRCKTKPEWYQGRHPPTKQEASPARVGIPRLEPWGGYQFCLLYFAYSSVLGLVIRMCKKYLTA